MGTNAYYLNQFISTTLATVGGIDDSQTTGIILTSVTGVETTKPGIVCLSYSDPIDTSKAEWISYTSISVTNELQGVTRGAEGFSAKSHSNGVTIAFPISESHINNLNDALIIDGAETNLVTGVISPSGTSSDSSTELVTKSYADGGLKDSLYRQAIINGNFDVWQRTTNVSLAPDAALFAADRWSCYSNHADYSFSRQDANLSGSQYCGRYQRASGSIGTNSMQMSYAGIEKSDAIKFRGKKLTLSFYAKKGANFSPSTFTAEIRTGTVGDENVWSMTNSTVIATLSPTLTTDWQKFTLTTSSVIASNVSEITIKFYTSACAGTAGAADYFDITQVQLCEGEVALPFMPKSYEEELRACQRYMEFLSGAVGRAISATVGTFGFSYKVTKRIAAGTTNVFFITGTNAVEVNTAIRTFTTCDSAYPTVTGGTFDFGGASSMTPPNMVILGSDKIYVDVEL